MDIFGPPPTTFGGAPKIEAPASSPADDTPALRDFHDVDATRQAIFSGALTAAQSIKPLSDNRFKLELADVAYDGPDAYTLKRQKEAILRRQSLGRKMVGTWRLSDVATGQPIEEKRTTLAKIPYLTQRGTFINNGSEYSLVNQLRLRPGIFSRIKENGEIEAHVNLQSGTGHSHRYALDPDKGVFYSHVGHAKIPLMPLLTLMGVNNDQFKEAWGDELFRSNSTENNAVYLRKYLDRMLTPKEQNLNDEEGQKKLLVAKLTAAPLDTEVTRRTLGHPYDRLTPDAILATTKKLLALSRGEADVDDRDNLAYQTLAGPDDLIAERISKDSGYVRQGLFRKIAAAGSLRPLLPGALDRQVRSALLFSGLGQQVEETNPGELLDKRSRLTRMGEGGIADSSAIPLESRAVQPSHLGYIDPIKTPESSRIGVDVHLASGARRGSDGRIYVPFTDAKTGEQVHRSPQQTADMVVAFPGEMDKQGKRVYALKNGRMQSVPRGDVDLVSGPFENSFSALSNLVPMKSASKGQRSSMGARMISQALAMREPESPLVQSGVPGEDDTSYEQKYGEHFGALRSKGPAKVLDVSPDAITLIGPDGKKVQHELYNDFVLNRKSMLQQTPLVRPGDTVAPGQLLAKSNYTDDQGQVAMGRNARVAFLAHKGNNYEDAISISQSFADKLTSEQAYKRGIEKTASHKMGRAAYLGLFPGRFNRKQLETLDENGVAKPGTTVQYGDPIVVAAQAVEQTRDRVHKKGGRSWQDATVIWDHAHPGTVVDASDDDQSVNVFVKSYSPAEVGDKISGRHGNKGVLSNIVPDAEMPHDTSGQPYEVLLNPQTVTTRGNPSQVFETLLGKIAAKTGKPYRVVDFDDKHDLVDYVDQELKKHELKDTEDLTDPETNTKIPGVLTGNMYVMKLMHMAEDKNQARSLGGYTQDETPSKGGGEGGKAKRLAMQDSNALISHGAYSILRDSHLIRGQANDDYWLSFMQGHEPAPPKIPFVYKKFVASLKASGINVVPDSRGQHLMAMTDKDVDELAGDRNIVNASTVDFTKGLKPVAGGLFDERLTGGHQSQGRWAAIKLAEPMPNPVFEEPIRRLLGLTQKKFEGILSGRESLPGTRPESPQNTGPGAIATALKNINIDNELAAARSAIAGTRKGARDDAIRKLGYLKTAQRLGIHPGDWIMSRVPVLPPAFRPISVMSDSKLPLVSDANYLYKGLLESNDALQQMSGRVDDLGDERMNVYNSFKAVVGLGDPIQPQYREKNIRGILARVLGSSPKQGLVQRRLLSASMDMVGRGVITPNPDFDMDTVGLPEDGAWSAYRNFVVRRLSRRGLPLAEALQHVEDRSPMARQELLAEMDKRPVLLNRAPVLHKYGIMAFKPKLVSGNTIQISPLVTAPFTADFDGDSVDGDAAVTVQMPLATAVKFNFQASSVLIPGQVEPGSGGGRVAINGKAPAVCRFPISEFPRLGLKSTNGDTSVYSVPDDVSVLSYDPELHRCSFEKVTEWTVHENCVGHEILTARWGSNSRTQETLIVSDDHSLFAYNPYLGRLARHRAADIADCYLPIASRVTIDRKSLAAAVENDPLLDGRDLDFDFGWWLGATALAGSSFWPNESRLAFGAKHQAVRRRYFALLGQLTGSHATDRLALSIGVGPIAEFIKRWIAPRGLERDAYRLPSFITLLPEECRRGVLTGALDAAELVAKKFPLSPRPTARGQRRKQSAQYCRFDCLSEGLAADLVLLCQSLGVPAGVHQRIANSSETSDTRSWHNKRPAGGHKTAAVTSVARAVGMLTLYGDQLTFVDPRKQKLLGSRQAACGVDIVPCDLQLHIQMLDYFKTLVGVSAQNNQPRGREAAVAELDAAPITRSNINVLRNRPTQMTRQRARFIVNDLRETVFSTPRFEAWAELVEDDSVRWVAARVLREMPPMTMYDLTVPTTKLFCVNSGVVVYDTMQYHVPISDAERREALERMLPSRNLISTQDFKSPMYVPRQEYLAGLYRATAPPEKDRRSRRFQSRADVLKAAARGDVSVDDIVEVDD